MIEKMNFVSITGPKSDIDRVVNTYLSKYEIHLENALTKLNNTKNLDPYIQMNPYKSPLNKANEYCSLLNSKNPCKPASLTAEESIALVESLDRKYASISQDLTDLDAKRVRLEDSMEKIKPFRELHYNLSSLWDFEFIRFRFGRISKEYYRKFQNYTYDNLDTFFYPCKENESYVWGAYFCPRSQLQKIDAVYASMHFERIYLPDQYPGTPDEAASQLQKELKEITAQAAKCRAQQNELLHKQEAKLLGAQQTLSCCSENFDIRKMAACTRDETEVFYILCGWMSARDAASFQQDIENDENVYFFSEDYDSSDTEMPPTKLRNPKIFKPFEMYIRMYGLPAYNEIDPTIFVSLTYAFIFGAMFGDVGQGLALAIGGFLLYKFRKMDLAGIIGAAGIFSTFFGFMYGSCFGFENDHPIWLNPKNHMSTLPFIGTLNTVFVVAIAFGMFLILLTMIFHIINAFKSKDTGDALFDHNSIAGLVFYASLVAVIFLFMTGHGMPASIVLAVMFGLPLLLILFKEPLTNLITRKKELLSGSKGMFVVQGFFELFEVLLSYFSNTLSFVRVGAFAVSHAAMMEVVLSLAGAEAGGNPNWIVVILGNLFVCGLEGLIVGIQVLRLEYYELFSRFYKGNGREFKPFIKRGGNLL